MAKQKQNTNVVPIGAAKSQASKIADNQKIAEEKVQQALASSGKRRVVLAREAQELDPNNVGSYILLAQEAKNRKEKLKFIKQAVEAGERELGPDWDTKFSGAYWAHPETRPLMSAMLCLAMDLHKNDEFSEALTVYRKLLEMNPNDNQGVRYLLAGCLFEAHCDDELEKFLEDWAKDISAELKYTKALHLFRKTGKSKQAKEALLDAWKRNQHVPVFLSEVFELPEKSPSRVGFGDESEAVAYAMDWGYIWFDTEGATEWMAQLLAPRIRTSFPDKAIAELIIKGLKGEWEE